MEARRSTVPQDRCFEGFARLGTRDKQAVAFDADAEPEISSSEDNRLAILPAIWSFPGVGSQNSPNDHRLGGLS